MEKTLVPNTLILSGRSRVLEPIDALFLMLVGMVISLHINLHAMYDKLTISMFGGISRDFILYSLWVDANLSYYRLLMKFFIFI